MKATAVGLDVNLKGISTVAFRRGAVSHINVQSWKPAGISQGREVLTTIEGCIEQARDNAGKIEAIGIAWDGVVRNNRIAVKSGMVGRLTDEDFAGNITPLSGALAEKYQVPVTIVNPGYALAMSQTTGSNADRTLFIAGFGLRGQYINNESEPAQMPGEFGKMVIGMFQDAPVDPETGLQGTWDQYVSPAGIERFASEAGIKDASFLNIIKLLRSEDEAAIEVARTAGNYLGFGISQICRQFKSSETLVDNLVFSGGVFSEPSGEIMIEAAKKMLVQQHNASVNLSLCRDPLAVAKGAAYSAVKRD